MEHTSQMPSSKIDHDENTAIVLSWRIAGSVETDSLEWRFITDGGETLAVRPVQLPSNARPFGVPLRVESALRAALPLVLVAHGLMQMPGAPEEPHGKGATADARRKYERDRERFYRAAALYEINSLLGRVGCKKPVPVRDPGGGGYTRAAWADIVKRLADAKNPGASRLEAIRVFIVHELFKGEAAALFGFPEGTAFPPPGGIVRDADLRRLVRHMAEAVGVPDLPRRVLLAYRPEMPGWFKGWCAEAVRARRMKPTEAEAWLAGRITFMAECGGGRFRHCYPVEDMAVGIADQEDRAPWQSPAIRREPEAPGVSVSPASHGTVEAGTGAKRGRPVKTSKSEDAAMIRQWRDVKAVGVGSLSEFANAKGVPVREVRAAIERARKREERRRNVQVK